MCGSGQEKVQFDLVLGQHETASRAENPNFLIRVLN